MKCNRDCFNCTHPDCDIQINLNAEYCANWYAKNQESKKAYQREYQRKYRARKKAEKELLGCLS